MYNQLLGSKLRKVSLWGISGVSGYRITLAAQMIIHAIVGNNAKRTKQYMNNIAVLLTTFIFLLSCSDIRKSNIASTVKNDSIISKDEDSSVLNKTLDTLISKKCDFNALLAIRKSLENLNKSQIRDLLFEI